MKSIISSAYSEWSEQDFKRYMDMFSLDPKQKINSLSKGMKMKYALTLALSHNAELLIMDEPTSGLDPLIRSQLLKVLTDYIYATLPRRLRTSNSTHVQITQALLSDQYIGWLTIPVL